MMSTTLHHAMPFQRTKDHLIYGGSSVVIHIVLLTAIGIMWQTHELEKPVPVVKVRLVEAQIPPSAQREGNQSPPRMQTKRMPLAQRHAILQAPQAVSTAIPMPVKTTISPVPPPVTTRTMSTPTRKVLEDTHATSVLAMRDLLKVAPAVEQSATPARESGLSSLQTPEGQAFAQPVPSIQTQSVSGPSDAPPARTVQTHRLLTSLPPGTWRTNGSKVGLGRTIPPVYPLVAREQGWEGTVRLRIVVDPEGHPRNVTIRQSSGHDVLDQAAVQAVQQWRFTPARDGNIPIQSIVEIPINFDLRHQG